jgi:hypothetical protein
LKTLGGFEISRAEQRLLVTTPLGRRHHRELRDAWHHDGGRPNRE